MNFVDQAKYTSWQIVTLFELHLSFLWKFQGIKNFKFYIIISVLSFLISIGYLSNSFIFPNLPEGVFLRWHSTEWIERKK